MYVGACRQPLKHRTCHVAGIHVTGMGDNATQCRLHLLGRGMHPRRGIGQAASREPRAWLDKSAPQRPGVGPWAFAWVNPMLAPCRCQAGTNGNQGPVKVRQDPRRGTRSLSVGETDGQAVARESTPSGSNILNDPSPQLPSPGGAGRRGDRVRGFSQRRSVLFEAPAAEMPPDLGILAPPTSCLFIIHLLGYAKYTRNSEAIRPLFSSSYWHSGDNAGKTVTVCGQKSI